MKENLWLVCVRCSVQRMVLCKRVKHFWGLINLRVSRLLSIFLVVYLSLHIINKIPFLFVRTSAFFPSVECIYFMRLLLPKLMNKLYSSSFNAFSFKKSTRYIITSEDLLSFFSHFILRCSYLILLFFLFLQRKYLLF